MSQKDSKFRHRQEPVTLEALLSLKRAERPNPAFWEKFDHQLKEKAIQSLWMEKQPFYKRLFGTPWVGGLTPLRGALCLMCLLVAQLHFLVPSLAQSLCSSWGFSKQSKDLLQFERAWAIDPVADALKEQGLSFVASSVSLGDADVGGHGPSFTLDDGSASWNEAPAWHIEPSLQAYTAARPVVFF